MNIEKQVNKVHYNFDRYVSKSRWNSIWHQVSEVLKLNAQRVLEIGPGPGLFKSTASALGVKVETLDLDPELRPDYVGSATALPFPDNTFDVVCSFQMLEHLPYEQSLKAFAEMVRVSKASVIISLPDAKTMWSYKFYIPKFGDKYLLIQKPNLGLTSHQFDGEHYWEINKKGYELQKVIRDLSIVCHLSRTYRVPDNPYHRFFIFSK